MSRRNMASFDLSAGAEYGGGSGSGNRNGSNRNNNNNSQTLGDADSSRDQETHVITLNSGLNTPSGNNLSYGPGSGPPRGGLSNSNNSRWNPNLGGGVSVLSSSMNSSHNNVNNDNSDIGDPAAAAVAPEPQPQPPATHSHHQPLTVETKNLNNSGGAGGSTGGGGGSSGASAGGSNNSNLGANNSTASNSIAGGGRRASANPPPQLDRTPRPHERDEANFDRRNNTPEGNTTNNNEIAGPRTESRRAASRQQNANETVARRDNNSNTSNSTGRSPNSAVEISPSGLLPAINAATARSDTNVFVTSPNGGENNSNSNNDQDGISDQMSDVAGTNSTGSGNEEDEDPMYLVALDIVRKARRAAAAAAAASPSSATTPPLATPVEAGLSFGATTTVGVQGIRRAATDARDARAALSALYERINSLSARAALIADPVKDVIYWANESAQRLFGRLDLVGSSLHILLPREISERHVGYVMSYVDRYHREYRKTGQGPDSRLLDVIKPRRLKVIRMNNGREQEFFINAWVRTLRLYGEPLHEPSRLMMLECFDAQQQHIDAQESKTFRAGLDNVSDAVVVADFSGRIEWVNKAMEKLSGYPLSMLLAQRASVNIFLDPHFIERHEGYLAHFRQTRRQAAAALESSSNETVVSRRTELRTSYGTEQIQLRVDVAFNRLVGYMKSTREYIPRDDFETERLKLLLPAAIVKLITHSSESITSHVWEFEQTTVMFTDVVNFSTWARNRPSKTVHQRMQPMFVAFEEIIQSFGGEVIHRIGDAVMAIFGFSGEERYHARYAVAAGVELQQWCRENNFQCRIGLHSGSIGAGIFGSAKGRPSLDAWGNVLCTAKRLESAGSPGALLISRAVLDSLGSRFASELHAILEAGKTEAKGVGEVETFLLRVTNAAAGAFDEAAAAGGAASAVILPEKFLQQVGYVKAKFARWRIQSEETERRLAELQRAMR